MPKEQSRVEASHVTEGDRVSDCHEAVANLFETNLLRNSPLILRYAGELLFFHSVFN